MGRMERIAALPDFPYRMKQDLAAMFVDESESTFRSKIGEKWPIGNRDGHNVFWYKDDLIKIMDGDKVSLSDDNYFGLSRD